MLAEICPLSRGARLTRRSLPWPVHCKNSATWKKCVLEIWSAALAADPPGSKASLPPELLLLLATMLMVLLAMMLNSLMLMLLLFLILKMLDKLGMAQLLQVMLQWLVLLAQVLLQLQLVHMDKHHLLLLKLLLLLPAVVHNHHNLQMVLSFNLLLAMLLREILLP
jgi:hypothetical protein